MDFLYIIYAIIAGLCILYSVINEESKIRFIFKVLTCFMFVLIGLINLIRLKTIFSIILFIGLLCSAIGDFFLGIKHLNHKKSMDFFGFIFFTLAQISYILNLIVATNFSFKWYLIFLIFIGLAIAYIYAITILKNTKNVKILVLIYSLFISGMLASCINYCVYYEGLNNSLIILFAGISFAISDFSLVFKYYGKKSNFVAFLNVFTYFAAQLLFLLSVH